MDPAIISAADETVEGAFHMVQGMSQIMQNVIGENKRLTKQICDLQAASARLQMELMNKEIESVWLDETILSLLNARSRR